MKKTKIILLLCMIAVFAVCIALLAGCDGGGVDYHYDYLVTFDYNVEGLGVPTNCETQYLGTCIKDGAKIVPPGSLGNATFEDFTVAGFYNEGWYTAVYDDEGNPVKNEDGSVALDKKWNFATDVVPADMTLYAHFVVNPTLTIVVEDGDDIVISFNPGYLYSTPSGSDKPQKKGYSVVGYYTDDTYTQKFAFPYAFTTENATCYALMLEGDWDVVTSVDTFFRALDLGKNMFLDVRNNLLNFEGRLTGDHVGADYNGKIYGNGCVLKNMTMDVEDSRSNGITNYSMFGNLGDNAEIKDLTFENAEFNMTVNALTDSTIKISFFATDISSSAKFENVKFKDCKLNYLGNMTKELDDVYGYYVSCPNAETYADIFVEAELTVTNKILIG